MERRAFVLGVAGGMLPAAHVAFAQSALQFGVIVVGVLNSGPASSAPKTPPLTVQGMPFGAASTIELEDEIVGSLQGVRGPRLRFIDGQGDTRDVLTERAHELVRNGATVIITVGGADGPPVERARAVAGPHRPAAIGPTLAPEVTAERPGSC